MNISDFWLKHAFNRKDEVKKVGNDRCELYCILTPKHNLWFYLFAFITAFKCICNMECLEMESEDKNAR